MPTAYLQAVNYQFRKDAVTYSLKGPAPFDLIVINSTEADIRATMAVPADNWGNADAVTDCQNKIAALYPAWDFTVLPDPEES